MTGTKAVPATMLPRGRGVVWFGVAGLVNAVGTGFFYPFQLLFFRAMFGFSLATIGLWLTVSILAVLPIVFRVGRLVDRVGARPVLVAAALLRAAVFVGYVRLHGIAAFVALSMLMAVCQRAEQTATPVLAAGVAPPGQVSRWLALNKVVFNAGIGGGALLASLVVLNESTGFAALGLVNAASFVVAALLYLPLPSGLPATRQRGGAAITRPWRDRLFMHLAVTNFVLLLVLVAVEVALPVYLIDHLHLPPWTVGLFFAVNTATLVLLQLPIGGHLDRHRPLPAVAFGAVLHGALLAALGTVAGLGFALQLALLMLGVVIYSLGEIIATQTLAVLLVTLPPERARGTYQALNQVLIGVVLACVPLFVTVFLDHLPVALWWTLLAMSVLVAVDMLALHQRSGRMIEEAVR